MQTNINQHTYVRSAWFRVSAKSAPPPPPHNTSAYFLPTHEWPRAVLARWIGRDRVACALTRSFMQYISNIRTRMHMPRAARSSARSHQPIHTHTHSRVRARARRDDCFICARTAVAPTLVRGTRDLMNAPVMPGVWVLAYVCACVCVCVFAGVMMIYRPPRTAPK